MNQRLRSEEIADRRVAARKEDTLTKFAREVFATNRSAVILLKGMLSIPSRDWWERAEQWLSFSAQLQTEHQSLPIFLSHVGRCDIEFLLQKSTASHRRAVSCWALSISKIITLRDMRNC